MLDYQDGGKIPPISVIIKSGRGLWLLWLLRDEMDPLIAQRAWPEKILQYQRVRSKIYEQLAHVGADARDALRLVRLPGSIHSESRAKVRYLFQADNNGRPFAYTLNELAQHFRVVARAERARTGGVSTRSALVHGHGVLRH